MEGGNSDDYSGSFDFDFAKKEKGNSGKFKGKLIRHWKKEIRLV